MTAPAGAVILFKYRRGGAARPETPCSRARDRHTSCRNRIDIFEGRFEIARIPRVGDAALQARKRQQRSDLPVRVVRKYAAEVARVVLVHRQQPVVIIVVARRDLHGGAVTDGDAVRAQLGACGRVDVVADLLAARQRSQ